MGHYFYQKEFCPFDEIRRKSSPDDDDLLSEHFTYPSEIESSKQEVFNGLEEARREEMGRLMGEIQDFLQSKSASEFLVYKSLFRKQMQANSVVPEDTPKPPLTAKVLNKICSQMKGKIAKYLDSFAEAEERLELLKLNLEDAVQKSKLH